DQGRPGGTRRVDRIGQARDDDHLQGPRGAEAVNLSERDMVEASQHDVVLSAVRLDLGDGPLDQRHLPARVILKFNQKPQAAAAAGEQLHQTFPNPAARYSCFNVRSATNIKMMVGTSRTIVTTAA